MVYFFETMAPKIGDRVISKITNFTDTKIIVELLEYDNLNANLFFSELAYKSIYKMKKNYKKDMILPLEVINTSTTYDIDLTTISLEPDETRDLIDKFNKINKIVKFFEYNENKMFRKTLLKSYDDYDYIINLFYKDVFTLYNIVSSWNDEQILEKVKNSFKPNKLYLEITFELISDKYYGLNDIKNKITNLELYIKELDEKIKINYIYLGAPNYKFIIKNITNNTDHNKLKEFADMIILNNEKNIRINNYNILEE